ncbi:30S ribosomal protein S4e [Methanomassiliicoccus luminyensis]|uniref:30S ribosomal protein S4e n=1 Tax=Methanomassiliicoccus luminyensis TaxID=1080712 RepID=UPI0003630352|nr:30S ribosomal protein S4e [Methanomassiliicoccus luminyensis]
MSNEMKRLTAPRSWPVKRKTSAWITKPSPGAHAIEESIPVNVVLRDLLHLCQTAQEVRQMLHDKLVLVDGKVATNLKQGLGLMDVLSLPKIDTHYRVVMDRRGKLQLVQVPGAKASWKLCRIEDKTTVPGGKTQLNLHDGRNILVEKDGYKTGDVLKIEVPSQKILDVYRLDKGSMALITSGSHVGETATVDEYTVTRLSADNLVKFTNGTSTIKSNVFVVGAKGSEVELPEEAAI